MQPNNCNIVSSIIAYLRFPATLFVVILHAYTTSRNIPMSNNIIYMHLSYILSLCIGQIGVPLFFTISGYLFFFNHNLSLNKYYEKCINRFRTLLIPYIFWNSFMILFYLIIENIPLFSSFFSGANMRINDYSLNNFIRAYWDCNNWNNGDGMPILQPFWYLRNLIVLSLLSPIIAILIKYLKWFVFIIPLLLWIFSFNLAYNFVSISFFTFGSICSINNVNIIAFLNKYNRYINLIFIAFLLASYFTHFYTVYDIIPLHRIMITVGVVFFINMGYHLNNKLGYPHKWQKASFLIFTLHLPIMIAIRKIEYKIFESYSELINVILYIISIIITLYICITTYNLLVKYFPKIIKITTGR